jgi:hypothetical protein
MLAIDRCDEPSYRPHAIIIACGDGNYGLSGLRWRGWNRRIAHARGKAYANDCVHTALSGTSIAIQSGSALHDFER